MREVLVASMRPICSPPAGPILLLFKLREVREEAPLKIQDSSCLLQCSDPNKTSRYTSLVPPYIDRPTPRHGNHRHPCPFDHEHPLNACPVSKSLRHRRFGSYADVIRFPDVARTDEEDWSTSSSHAEGELHEVRGEARQEDD